MIVTDLYTPRTRPLAAARQHAQGARTGQLRQVITLFFRARIDPLLTGIQVVPKIGARDHLAQRLLRLPFPPSVLEQRAIVARVKRVCQRKPQAFQPRGHIANITLRE